MPAHAHGLPCIACSSEGIHYAADQALSGYRASAFAACGCGSAPPGCVYTAKLVAWPPQISKGTTLR